MTTPGEHRGSARCPRCGDALAATRIEGLCARCLATRSIEPFVIAGKFELGDEIGEGGMATVYRARDLSLDRDVAVKVLREDLAGDPRFRARFEREAKVLGRLRHPGIVAVHAAGFDDGVGFIAMELAVGDRIEDLVPLPLDRALELGAEIADALEAAHAAGVIHRDVKPSNVLLDAEGHAKLGDFGIARLADGEEALTAPRDLLGTPHYIAPEALAGASVDARADLYALGVLVYQMISGKLPLGDFASLPAGVDEIVRRALAPDPAERQASAAELARDLRAARRRLVDRVEDVATLPPDEQLWVRGGALLLSLATAIGLWALLECVRPRVIEPGDERPLVMLGSRAIAGGRLLSPARFELGAVLVALAAWLPAIAALGALRRRWRQLDLRQPEPGPAASARRVLLFGAAAAAVYAVRLALGPTSAIAPLIPVVGGALELAVLLSAWEAVLASLRTSRPLSGDARLWLGLALALGPPVAELARALAAAP